MERSFLQLRMPDGVCITCLRTNCIQYNYKYNRANDDCAGLRNRRDVVLGRYARWLARQVRSHKASVQSTSSRHDNIKHHAKWKKYKIKNQMDGWLEKIK